jgi:hypothetical protein
VETREQSQSRVPQCPAVFVPGKGRVSLGYIVREIRARPAVLVASKRRVSLGYIVREIRARTVGSAGGACTGVM